MANPAVGEASDYNGEIFTGKAGPEASQLPD